MPWIIRDARCGNLMGLIPGDEPVLVVESKEKRRAWARIPLVAMRATVEWAYHDMPGGPIRRYSERAGVGVIAEMRVRGT